MFSHLTAMTEVRARLAAILGWDNPEQYSTEALYSGIGNRLYEAEQRVAELEAIVKGFGIKAEKNKHGEYWLQRGHKTVLNCTPEKHALIEELKQDG